MAPKKKWRSLHDEDVLYAPKLAAAEYKDKTQPRTFKGELDELMGRRRNEAVRE